MVSWAKNARNEEGSFSTPATGEFYGKKVAAKLSFFCLYVFGPINVCQEFAGLPQKIYTSIYKKYKFDHLKSLFGK